ncbi:MAG: GxxExxY protein [Acidobacteria bacterium]|nr:GxxExxY protein [Acidobacteriota bacterium]
MGDPESSVALIDLRCSASFCLSPPSPRPNKTPSNPPPRPSAEPLLFPRRPSHLSSNDAAFEVSNTLGTGFLEKVYERALLHELSLRGITAVSQVKVEVLYQGASVGDYFPDILVLDELILELKCAETIASEHVAKCLNFKRPKLVCGPSEQRSQPNKINRKTPSQTKSTGYPRPSSQLPRVP